MIENTSFFSKPGKSGVRVGISGSSDPVMTDFGDLYANFDYHGNGGKMEVHVIINYRAAPSGY